MGSKKVFITQSAFYAFIDHSDAKHQMASAFFRYFAQERYHLFSTPSTIMDTYQQIQSNMSHSIARDFLRTIFTSTIDILYVDEPTMKAATKLVITTTNTSITMDQAIANIVCDRSQIGSVCTFAYFPYFFGIKAFTLPF